MTTENEKTKKKRRCKGDGALFKNSRGTWTSRYKGKEFTASTKSEAKSKMDQYKVLVSFGETFSKRMSVKQYGEKFLYHKSRQNSRGNIKDTTLDRLERTFENQIVPSKISNVLMQNLTGDMIQDFIDDLSRNYSYSTIRKAYLFLSAMITFGVEHKDFPKSYDPLLTVELPNEAVLHVKTKQISIIPDDQIEIIKKVAMSVKKDGTLEYRYGPLIVFGLNTGLREGELLALSRNGIRNYGSGRRGYHVSEGVSTVRNRDKNATSKLKRVITSPKYPRSIRTVPLNKEADYCLNMMLELYEKNEFREDLIVSTQNGLLPTSRNIQTTLDRILKRAGLPHYGTHAMRHTFATKLLKETHSHQQIKAVAELLGDDYKVVVNTYLHTEEDGKHELVDMLA